LEGVKLIFNVEANEKSKKMNDIYTGLIPL